MGARAPSHLLWLAFGVLVALAACGAGVAGHADGTEKGHCYPNGTCNVGLSWFSNRCVLYALDGGGGSGGASDAGSDINNAGGITGGNLAGMGGQVGASGASGGAGSAGSSAAGRGGTTGAAAGIGGGGGSAGAGGVAGATSTAGSGGVAGAMSTAGSGGGPPPTCDTTIDLGSSDQNCGACGYACVHGRHCSAGRCAPAWQSLSTTNAPLPRGRAAAGFVAGKYVLMGGAATRADVAMSTTHAYDVAADTWSQLAPLAVARCAHEAVSTGTSIVTFGGCSDCGNGSSALGSLEVFTPNAVTGTWSTVTGTLPAARYDFGSAWTGHAFFFYGGANATGPAIASGALFSPANSTWSDASCSLAGCERGGIFTAFADGAFIRVWGGAGYGSGPAGITFDTTGGGWASWTIPVGTDAHLAQRFADDGRRLFYLTAQDVVSIYDRKSSSWLANDTSTMPAGFSIEGASAWTGTELISWSGSTSPAVPPVAVGGRYQPPAPP